MKRFALGTALPFSLLPRHLLLMRPPIFGHPGNAALGIDDTGKPDQCCQQSNTGSNQRLVVFEVFHGQYFPV